MPPLQKNVPPADPACGLDESVSGAPQRDLPLPGAPLPYDRGPRLARLLKKMLQPLDRLFDYAFQSRYNPLYRSGTLAMGLMVVAVATGVILLLWYRIGAPYESMQRIQSLWPLRLLRGLHRYASDACMIAVGFHLLRMAAEGKAWGPRALAWVSGVILLGFMLVIGWTGFVLLWDDAAVHLAMEAARLLDALPVFSDPISRAFSGAAPVPASFFFMSLFLHMSLPLLMLLGLWMHTSRLARSSWLPEKKPWALATLALAVLALAWPAPLGAPGDLLQKGSVAALDFFYNFWMLLAPRLSSEVLLASAGLCAFGLASMPWWWRPAAERQPKPSFNDPSRCEGCNQCVLDCPFEAVALVPRPFGKGSALVASVDPALCVSCGICVGSCDRLSIAPPDRDARSMLLHAAELKRQSPQGGLVYFYCLSNTGGAALAEELAKRGTHVVPYPVDCLGQLHPVVALSLLKHFKGLLFHGCPPQLCQMREGYALLVERLQHGRKPAPEGALDQERLALLSLTSAEGAEALFEAEGFLASLGLLRASAAPAPKKWPRLRAAAGLSGLLIAGLGQLSTLKAGKASEKSWLRLAWRLPGQAQRDCRPYSQEELASLPAHMRRKEKCETKYLDYGLRLWIDKKELKALQVSPQGSRGDRPLVVDRDIEVPAGRHQFQVEFSPLQGSKGQALRIKGAFDAEFRPGRAVLLTLAPDGRTLALRGLSER